MCISSNNLKDFITSFVYDAWIPATDLYHVGTYYKLELRAYEIVISLQMADMEKMVHGMGWEKADAHAVYVENVDP